MYSYDWDEETGGLLLNSAQQKMSKEPRPVYYKELDILGFDKYWNYAKDDSAPLYVGRSQQLLVSRGERSLLLRVARFIPPLNWFCLKNQSLTENR